MFPGRVIARALAAAGATLIPISPRNVLSEPEVKFKPASLQEDAVIISGTGTLQLTLTLFTQLTAL